MRDLNGKTILVTGASSGIGYATVRRLAGTGAKVVAHYNSNRVGAERAVADFSAGSAFIVEADLAHRDGATELWKQAIVAAGAIDVLVLNAGVMPKVELAADDEEWEATLEFALQVNLRSQMKLVRDALKHFEERGGGTLIGLSSWVTQRGAGNANLSVYAASKAATAAMLKTVARAYADRKVLTYLIAPGAVNTQMTAASAEDQGGMESYLRGLTMGEMVPPDEIAELVAILSEGKVRHLSGATLDINGASYIR